jgi:hypothetical protein
MSDFVPLLPATGLAVPNEEIVKQARSMVAAAAERLAELQNPTMSAMPDPFGGPWKVYRQTAADIRDLSVTLVERLFGVVDMHALPPVPKKLGRARKAFWR